MADPWGGVTYRTSEGAECVKTQQEPAFSPLRAIQCWPETESCVGGGGVQPAGGWDEVFNESKRGISKNSSVGSARA